MIVTTTLSIEGRDISSYLGLVTGEAIMGVNVFKDIMAGIRNIVGGRSKAYEKELENAREIALSEIKERAKTLGADAIVGVDLDYETIGSDGNNMLMVSISGTAVSLR